MFSVLQATAAALVEFSFAFCTTAGLANPPTEPCKGYALQVTETECAQLLAAPTLEQALSQVGADLKAIVPPLNYAGIRMNCSKTVNLP